MYKIYINEIPVTLIKSEMTGGYTPVKDDTLILPYLGKPRSLFQIIKLCEPPYKFKEIIIYAHEPEKIIDAIKTQIKEIVAAGGIVYNEFNEVLFIYRRGFWDLPKGKLDPGETLEQAAIREVEEETGIKGLTLHTHVGNTYHIFRTQKNSNYYLKKTYWYRMSTQKQAIKVQKEEDIDEAVWLAVPTFLKECKPIYNNIQDILKKV